MGPPRQSNIEDFGDILLPSEAQEPILARPVRNALLEWLTEIWAHKELAELDLEPRRKAIFDGPPGVGKTTLAHHLAARLGLPMLVVLPDRFMTAYVSESGRSVGVLFDLIADHDDEILIFLDEIESIAQKRMSTGFNPGLEANHNHTVNTLLKRLEACKAFVIAATNMGDQIDQAVWRRFEIHMTLDLPGQFERERIIARYLHPFGLPPEALTGLAEAFETASPALIRQFCENLKRQIVVGPKVDWNMQREAVVDRLISAVKPHPDLGKPRLWSHGHNDQAVRAMPWPLPMATDLADQPIEPDDDNVVSITEARPGP